jgi:hypothetical protein
MSKRVQFRTSVDIVADPNVAVGHAGAISAMPVSSRSAELFYEPSKLPLAR